MNNLINEEFVFNPRTMIKVDISGYWLYAQMAGNTMVKSKLGTEGYKVTNESDNDLECLELDYDKWQRKDYKSFTTGLLGELGYALETGLQPDFSLKPFGDSNEDFPGIDVKSTWMHNATMNKKLVGKKYKDQKKKVAKYFVKANVDFNTKEVILVGWCKSEDLFIHGSDEKLSGKEQYGDNRTRKAFHYTQLNPMHTLPPYIEAKTKQFKKMQEDMWKYMGTVYHDNK